MLCLGPNWTLGALTDELRKVVSTLSILEPFRRAVVGIPFLYQKVTVLAPMSQPWPLLLTPS